MIVCLFTTSFLEFLLFYIGMTRGKGPKPKARGKVKYDMFEIPFSNVGSVVGKLSM